MNKSSKNPDTFPRLLTGVLMCLGIFLIPAFFAVPDTAKNLAAAEAPPESQKIEKTVPETDTPPPEPPNYKKAMKKIQELEENPGTGEGLAVARGLLWLARHQHSDGGWSFAHTRAPGCKAKCENPGMMPKARNAATALALLPMLGVRITHKEGIYKENVRAGLSFLCDRIKLEPGKDGSFQEDGGTMVSHGLTTLCLTEAYGRSKDKNLRIYAQLAVNHIVTMQDPESGGWRYLPTRKCDTSVTGLQMLALKSGYAAYLSYPAETAKNTMTFLDAVQTHDGAFYGFDRPGEDATGTAVGLLCRMYYGWRSDRPALEEGVEWLSRCGPAEDDVHHNYYATQVMRHYGGPHWEKWYPAMRDRLVAAQVTDAAGHEYGSWYHPSEKPGYEQGGRHYVTAMSLLTLNPYHLWEPRMYINPGIRIDMKE